jgi:peptidoglycan DL-endopeptidase CwlS
MFSTRKTLERSSPAYSLPEAAEVAEVAAEAVEAAAEAAELEVEAAEAEV